MNALCSGLMAALVAASTLRAQSPGRPGEQRSDRTPLRASCGSRSNPNHLPVPGWKPTSSPGSCLPMLFRSFFALIALRAKHIVSA